MKYKDKLIMAKEYRRSPTRAENILWQALRRKQLLNLKFRRQHVIDGFILDFYCHALKLGIEIDGPVHENKESLQYDSSRSDVLRRRKIRILRIRNDDVKNKINKVIKALQTHIKPYLSVKDGEVGSASRNRERS